MSEVSVVIVEDELHNSRLLGGMVNALRPDWEIEAVLESVEESVDWLNSHPAPDLLLLDIQLSDGISFAILEQVEMPAKTQVVFTTAYDKYAIRAFKVNSVDYLLKPIKEEELEAAFHKYESCYLHQSSAHSDFDKGYYKEMMHAILSGKREYRTRFLISGIKDYTKVMTSDIAYFYSSNKTVFAVGFDEQEHLLDYSLEQLENELNPQSFYRSSRQVIINIDAVQKVSNASGNKLKILTRPAASFEMTVSRLKATDFKRWLGK